MDYLELLERSYKIEQEDKTDLTRYEYLSEWIFDFTTYDGVVSDIWGKKALEVCWAITDSATFSYQKKSDHNYMWYLIMCNMPFFMDKLEWGSSVRGAWWDLYGDNTFEIVSCGLYDSTRKQILKLKFDGSQWTEFIHATRRFAWRKFVMPESLAMENEKPNKKEII